MRQRTAEINVRVFQSEKEKIRRNAKKAGLTVSDYIRNTALKSEIKSAPSEDFIKVYQLVKDIHDEFRWNKSHEKLNEKFEQIENILLNLYHGKSGEAVGGNENLAD